jgi:hypothetical protein
LAVLSRYLRKRFAAWRTQAHSGWVSLLGVIVLAAIAWQRAGEIAEAGRSVQEVLRNIAAVPVRDLARAVDGDMIFFVLFLLLYVWLFLTALQTLVKHLPAWIEDLKRLWAEVKDFYEDHIQVPSVIRQIPPACRGDSANPFLWQAAMAYISNKPLIEADPCGYSGKIETDWFVSSQAPLQRTQLIFYIRQRLNEFALQVYADKQERRLGLIWVEIEDDRAARKQIAAAIFARAKALAAQAGVIEGE